MKLHKETIKHIHSHALKEYPFECCGIVTGNDRLQRVHQCENIQNRLHAEDPSTYARDARTAYTIDRKELDGIVASAEEKGEKIIAFYHSHPEHASYFSEDDHAAQTVFGEPEFPESLQIVVSVMSGNIHDMKGFRWSKRDKCFLVDEDYF